MNELVDCIDCKRQISRNANVCPKCESKFPLGVLCQVCKKKDAPISIRLAHTHPHKNKNQQSSQYYHSECVQKLLTIPYSMSCPDCKEPLSKMWNWWDLCEYIEACPNCGMPNPLGSGSECYECKLPTFKFNRVFFESEVGKLACHESCLPEAARIANEKRRLAEINYLKKKRFGKLMLFPSASLFLTLAFAILAYVIVGMGGCGYRLYQLEAQQNTAVRDFRPMEAFLKEGLVALISAALLGAILTIIILAICIVIYVGRSSSDQEYED